MKRSLVALAAVGSVGIALALRARRRDVTDGRATTSRSVTIRRNADDLYAMWQSETTLTTLLHRVESVEQRGSDAQRWTFQVAGKAFPVDVAIVRDQPARMIEWRAALPGPYGAQLAVTFVPLVTRGGTEVRMSIAATGPAARAVSAFARIFGASLDQIARESLRNFKALAEAGETPKAVRD